MTSSAGDTPSPYVGLRPFTADDADRFFARERWTRIVVGNVAASRLTLLYGESGVGKTSLLQAGVEHELRAPRSAGVGRRAGSRLVPIVFRNWQGDPATSLIGQVAALAGNGRDPPGDLSEAVRHLAAARKGRVVLILDQFEEYLLYHPRREGPGSVPSHLARLVEEPRLSAAVVISIREDALARLDPLKRAIPRLYDNLLHLERVDAQAAAETITGPIDWYNAHVAAAGGEIDIEEPLVRAVLGLVTAKTADSEDRTVEFAYLQLVLERLWREAREAGVSRLDMSMLDRIPGGAEEIMRDHVERAVSSLTADQRDLAADAFNYLVTPSGGKIAWKVVDLGVRTGRPPEQVAAVVQKLSSTDTRLLRPVGVPVGERVEPGVEIYHDKLAEPILRWNSEHLAERQREQARIEARALERRRRRRLGLISLLVGGVLVIALLGLLLVQMARNGELERSSRLAADATSQLSRDPQLSLLLAREAVAEEATPEAVEALRSALVASRVRHLIAPGTVSSMALSPAGRTLVTGSLDGMVQIWDARTGRRLSDPLPAGTGKYVREVELSTGTDRFLTTSGAQVEVRSLPGGRSIQRLGDRCDLAAKVRDADIARGGARVAIVKFNGTVCIWRLDAGPAGAVSRLGRVGGEPTSVAMSPDGANLITTGSAGARIWTAGSAGDGRQIVPGPTATASFSPDGRLAGIAGDKGKWYLWDGATARAVPGHRGPVTTVTFRGDGARVATGGSDQTVRLWAVEPLHVLTVLSGHAGTIKSVRFSDTGRRVATGSTDGTARVWVPGSGRSVMTLAGHRGPVRPVQFGAGGILGSLSSRDGTARIWETDAGRSAARTDEEPPDDGSPAAGADEARLGKLTAKVDGNRVKITGRGRPFAVSHSRAVRHVAFSEGGDHLVTSSDDGTARVWDVRTGRSLAVLGEHGDTVKEATFGPDEDSRFVVDVSDDGCARLWLWDVEGGALVARFPDDPCGSPKAPAIRSARFDTSGERVFLTDGSGGVRLYTCLECGGADDLMKLADDRVERELTDSEREEFEVDD